MDQNQVEVELNDKQLEVDNAEESEIFYISGVGGGKSFELGQWVLERSSIPESIGLLAAPSHDVMRQSTLPQVQESWQKVGVIQGDHYVINIAPPEEWNVRPFSPISNNRIITFSWGAYLVLDTLDNVNKARGAEYDYIAIDEFRDVKFSEVRTVLLGRLRGRKFKKIGKRHQILWASTPPDNTTELNEILDKHRDKIKLVEGSSYDNKKNLPENYIENLESLYDPLTAAREIMGSRRSSTLGRPFMYCFEDSRHIGEKAVYQDGNTVYLSFDFNVNPMTCVIVQSGQGYIHFIDEIYVQNADIYDVCNRIKSKYPNNHFMVTGDRSGMNRSGLNKNMNYYKIIKEVLDLKDVQFKIPNNPYYEQNIVLCNSILAKHPEVLFNPQCKETIYDMRFVEWDGEKVIKDDRTKKAQRADLFDCVRYYFNTFHHNFIKHA